MLRVYSKTTRCSSWCSKRTPLLLQPAACPKITDTMMRRLLVATSLAIALGAGDDHAGHDHGDAFEWAGTFATPNKIYFWQAEKVGGDYADPAMKIAFLPVSGTDMATLKAEEKEGSHALEETCEAVNAGGTMKPMKDKCYSLKFECQLAFVRLQDHTSATSNVAIFAEHVPTEFERNSHYLKDIAGEDIGARGRAPRARGLQAVGCRDRRGDPCELGDDHWRRLPRADVCQDARPAPEGHVRCDQHLRVRRSPRSCLLPHVLRGDAPHQARGFEPGAAKPRGGVLRAFSGFLASYIIDLFMSILLPGKAPSTTATTKDVEGADTLAADAGRSTRTMCVLLGDFMHNLVDGFFIGFGFMMCKDSFGWMITGTTIGHEIAQEIADYLVLTDAQSGQPQACEGSRLQLCLRNISCPRYDHHHGAGRRGQLCAGHVARLRRWHLHAGCAQSACHAPVRPPRRRKCAPSASLRSSSARLPSLSSLWATSTARRAVGDRPLSCRCVRAHGGVPPRGRHIRAVTPPFPPACRFKSRWPHGTACPP